MTTVVFATSVVEQGIFPSMQSLSLQYARTLAADPALFEILRGVVSADRNWIHFLDKILSGGSILLLHLALFRANLVPRFLSAFGVAAALTQMSGISLEPVSFDLPMLMLAPLGLAQFALCFTLACQRFCAIPRVRRACRTGASIALTVMIVRRNEGGASWQSRVAPRRKWGRRRTSGSLAGRTTSCDGCAATQVKCQLMIPASSTSAINALAGRVSGPPFRF